MKRLINPPQHTKLLMVFWLALAMQWSLPIQPVNAAMVGAICTSMGLVGLDGASPSQSAGVCPYCASAFSNPLVTYSILSFTFGVKVQAFELRAQNTPHYSVSSERFYKANRAPPEFS